MARWRAEEGAGMEWPEEGAARKKEHQGWPGMAPRWRARGVGWAGPPEKGAEEHAASRRRAAEAEEHTASSSVEEAAASWRRGGEASIGVVEEAVVLPREWGRKAKVATTSL